MTTYTITKSEENKDRCEKMIELEISAEEIGRHRAKSLKSMATKADLPGFRKGHVPEKVIEEKMGEAAILEESINSWLQETIGSVLQKEAPSAIALPRVDVKKAVPGNPVALSLRFPLRPNLILGDYKAIAKEQNKKKSAPEGVTDKDVDAAILRLRQYAARAVNPDKKEEPKDDELPPLNDQFAEAVGGGKTVAELRERIKKDLQNENERRAKEKLRLEIIDEMLKKTEGHLPDILIDYEIDKMEAELENDVKKMGLKLEDYLNEAHKTEEQLHKDWRPAAEKRAKINIILSDIKQKEKLELDPKEVEHEVSHIIEHQKDADREHVKSYVERLLGNQKVFEFLEKQE